MTIVWFYPAPVTIRNHNPVKKPGKVKREKPIHDYSVKFGGKTIEFRPL